MRRTNMFLILLSSVALSIAHAQLPSPTVPDNTIDSTNSVGIPPTASREGDREVVNLHSGSLNFLIPAVTLSQRAGAAPLTIGFTYDSSIQNLQLNAGVSVAKWGDSLGGCDGYCEQYVDTFHYSAEIAQTSILGLPLDWNIPRISGSLEYDGDWVNTSNYSYSYAGARFCITNISFRDWEGNTHVFPKAKIACSNEDTGGFSLVFNDVSSDNQGYVLVTYGPAHMIVYAPDGTTYQFGDETITSFGNTDLGSQSQSVEQYLLASFSSSKDRYGNVIRTGGGGIIDTLGRHIELGTDPSSGMPYVHYKDSHGQLQTVTVSASLPSSDLKIPQASGRDMGMYFGGVRGDSCSVTYGQQPMPAPQYDVSVMGMPSDWLPPLQDGGREYYGLQISYSATGQSYKMLFDTFGHLLRVRYPEGGYHRYDYALYSTTQQKAAPITCQWRIAEVAHRYECSKSAGDCSNQEEATTTYCISADVSSMVGNHCIPNDDYAGVGQTA